MLHVQLARKVEGKQFFEVWSAKGQPAASARYAQVVGGFQQHLLFADWAASASKSLRCEWQRLAVLWGKLQRPVVLWTCATLRN